MGWQPPFLSSTPGFVLDIVMNGSCPFNFYNGSAMRIYLHSA